MKRSRLGLTVLLGTLLAAGGLGFAGMSSGAPADAQAPAWNGLPDVAASQYETDDEGSYVDPYGEYGYDEYGYDEYGAYDESGYDESAYDESSFDDVTTFGIRGAATWNVTPLTQLEAEVERSVEPTATNGASSKIRTEASLKVRHELFRSVVLRADATYRREKFKELGRTDDDYRFRVGAEYLINRFFSIGVRYRYWERDSNFSSREFRRNTITLRLDARL